MGCILYEIGTKWSESDHFIGKVVVISYTMNKKYKMENNADPDPFGYDNKIIPALLKNPHGLTLNQLSNESGVHKEILNRRLDNLEKTGVVAVKREDYGKNGRTKFNIRLKDIADVEELYTETFSKFIDDFYTQYPNFNEQQQAASVIHCIHNLAIMNMSVICEHISDGGTTNALRISQNEIINQVEKLQRLIHGTLSGMSDRKRTNLLETMRREGYIAWIYLKKKAELGASIGGIRIKERTVEDLLCDLDIHYPHSIMIDELNKTIMQYKKDEGGKWDDKRLRKFQAKVTKKNTRSVPYEELQNQKDVTAKFEMNYYMPALNDFCTALMKKASPEQKSKLQELPFSKLKGKINDSPQIHFDMLDLSEIIKNHPQDNSQNRYEN